MPDSVIIYRESLQPFSAACGNQQALTLAIAHRKDQAATDIQSFDKPFVRIGRSIHNDLMLADDAVSFRHIYMQMVDGHWAYFNLHSTVRSKGRRRQQPTWGWLDEARELNVGPFVVSPQPAGLPDQSSDLPPRDRAMTPAVAEFELELVNRQNSPARRIQRPVTLIGSARHCDLWLKDPSVSSVHASLVLTSRGVWVVDLLGRNGVTVDRKRVSWKQLQNGSFLEIGHFCFRVWINSAEPLTIDPRERPPVHKVPADQSLTAGPIDGTVTRDFVMGVLNHLVESRTEFFEHLQHQSQLIQQLFQQLSESRPAPLARELQRIEELDRELTEIKQQLSRSSAVPESAEKLLEAAPLAPDDVTDATATEELEGVADYLLADCPPELPSAAEAVTPEENSEPVAPEEVENSSETGQPDQNELIRLERSDRSRPPAEPAISVQDAHALLSQRMSRLAHERSSLLLSVLRRLGLARRL